MEKSIQYKGVKVAYDDRGEGSCILLLHGYLESKEIWQSFTEDYLKGYRVVAVDIPGHGSSGTWGREHTMDDLAGSVLAVMEEERIQKVFLVGHSMGGYVAMAFADLYGECLSGYSLFHSTCFPDTDEKRKDRDREINLIMCGKKRQIIQVNIPKGFADMNLKIFSKEVEMARQLAMTTSDDGIVAILNGMKSRPDRTKKLEDSTLPLLLIGGMKDNYIPVDIFERLVSLAPHAQVARLQRSGHMGFIEEPARAAESIKRTIDLLSADS